MKRRIVSVLLCFLLTICVVCSAVADVSTLDSALSRWLEGNSTIDLSASFTLNALEPYPEETLAMLNGVLKHVNANVRLENDADESLTSVQLTMDAAELFHLTERETATESSTTLSLLPNRVLTSAVGSPIELLTADDSASEQAFSVLEAVKEVQNSYGSLIEACSAFAEEKKANYKIKGIGTARFSKIARLTTEQSDTIRVLICDVLGSGMDTAFRERLKSFSFAKGFVVALYQNADRQDIAVYMKGTMLDAEGKKYSLAYQWAFVNEGVKREDTYKFELKSVSRPTDQRVIAASCDQSMFTDHFSFDAKTTTTRKTQAQVDVDTVTLDLSGKKTDNALTILGTLDQERKLTANGDTSVDDKRVTLDLLLSPESSGSVLSGTIGYTSTLDKTTTVDLSLALAKEVPQTFVASSNDESLYSVIDAPESSLEQTLDVLENEEYLVGTPPEGLKVYSPPASKTTISLDTADDATRSELLAEAAQNLAGSWLLQIAKLPDEDAALLKDGMTDTDYAAFLSLLDSF